MSSLVETRYIYQLNSCQRSWVQFMLDLIKKIHLYHGPEFTILIIDLAPNYKHTIEILCTFNPSPPYNLPHEKGHQHIL